MSDILYEENGYVGLLTLNRPEALNALNGEVFAELAARLEAAADSRVRCLVVTGAGNKAFVAGADIRELRQFTSSEAIAFCRAGNEALDRLENFPAPVIAAVNGYALGGGLELALCCDFRHASEDAAFGLPEASLGVIPCFGGLQRLARVIGEGMTKELVYTAGRLTASEALALGLVNGVHPKDALLGRCLEMARSIAANPPVAVRLAKDVINRSLHAERFLGLEVPPFGECFTTRDQQEAMDAFVEKRPPRPFLGE